MTRLKPRRRLGRVLFASLAFLAGFGCALFGAGVGVYLLTLGGRNAAAQEVKPPNHPTPPVPEPRGPKISVVVANTPARVQPMPGALAPQGSPATAAMPVATPEPLTDQLRRRLSEAYKLKADVAVEHRPAQLILLPDRQPVTLKASAERPATLPASFREISCKIHWSADCGKVTKAEQQPGTDTTQATLTLPEGSRVVTLHTMLDAVLSRTAGAELTTSQPDKVEVHQEESFRLLTPISSSLMKDGVIDGFNVGHYLRKPRPLAPGEHAKSSWPHRYPDRYEMPAFFYKITPAINDLTVAPDQPIGMYMIDFPWKSLGKTQYIALDTHLVLKLDDLLNLMRKDGHKITRFVPIYGFRPPSFNLTTMEEHPGTTLKTAYSMHQYGRAIDMIIDEDGDNVIDDLNHDGTIDIRDPAVIMKYVNQLDRQYAAEKRMDMVGGAGLYWRNDFIERTKFLGKQSPYIHVDTRGFLGDGGNPIRWYEPDDKPAPKKAPSRSVARPAAAKNPTTPSTTRASAHTTGPQTRAAATTTPAVPRLAP